MPGLRNATFFACAAISGLWIAGCANGTQGVNLDGASVDPLADGNAVTVLAFVTSECPISNQYLPELKRIDQAFQARGVRIWLVYPSALDDVAKIRRHVAEFATGLRALRDPEHRLVKRAGATVTPEVAVFDRTRQIAYAGRIDDRYAALGVSSVSAKVHDLQAALDDVLAGKPPKPSRTAAIGCSISE